MKQQHSKSSTKEFYHSLPKVELHRHLEGSLRLDTMMEVAHEFSIDIPQGNPSNLRSMVQVNPEEPFTFENFLSKFDTLRQFYRSKEIIQRITKEAVADAAADNVKYLELRFTPVALSRICDFALSDVMDWVIDSVTEAEKNYGVMTRLIASFNRHESREQAEKVAALAADRISKGIVGLDLAGDEANFSAKPFAGIFKEAKQAGLRLTAHAGEWGEAENIIEAINVLDAERIGHGVRVFENPKAVSLAKDREVTFEVCPTSNYQSGVVSSLELHPLPKMIKAGLNVTINTDDPSISAINLGDEYQTACEVLSISIVQLRESVLNAARAAFLQDGESTQLVNKITEEFPLNS